MGQPVKFYWKQCYELSSELPHWALCDTETDSESPPNRISSVDLVVINNSDADFANRPLPKLIVELLNAHFEKVQR